MKKIKILVLGTSGDVSQGIIKSLKESTLSYELYGACVEDVSIGQQWCDSFSKVPYAKEETFIPWLIHFCNKEEIDLVLTGVEENIYAIAQSLSELNEKTKTLFKFSSKEQLDIGQNKWNTCQWLEAHQCNFPQYRLATDKQGISELVEKVGYPLIAKPIHGKGSSGLKLMEQESDWLEMTSCSDYIIQEYVGSGDEEYTVGTYCNQKGDLVEMIIMKRVLKNGGTFFAEVVDHEKVAEEVRKICKQFKPVGPMNIQLRINGKGEPVAFEFNVRFSGTTAIRSFYGFRDVEALVREYVYQEEIASCFQVRKGSAIRYMSEVFF